MRVLIIFNHPAPYKVKVFNELAKHVDLTVLFERTKERNRPDAFYSNNEYNFDSIFLKDGYVRDDGSISSKVRDYIKKHHGEYDIIIMNGYSHLAEIKAIRYMSKHNIKFALQINGGLIKKESKLKKAYKTSLINKASYYLSPSRYADEYLVYYGANRNKILPYIYTNYSESEVLKEPIKSKDELRDRFNLPKGKRIFVNACQFIERKNNIQLISLFKNRDDVLLLVGEGPEKDKYLSYIKENNMNNVIVLPFMEKSELFDLLKACDVYITLSKEDIFGHTTLEAFSNGLPVISSNKVVSSVEYVKDGYNGYLVSLENDALIAQRMDEITKSMSIHALESARNNTFEKNVESLLKALGVIYGK